MILFFQLIEDSNRKNLVRLETKLRLEEIELFYLNQNTFHIFIIYPPQIYRYISSFLNLNCMMIHHFSILLTNTQENTASV